MSCPDLNEIYSYLEQVLPGEGRARVEEHLVACSRCRRLLADRCLYLKSISGLPEPALPPDFSDRVMASLPSLKSSARFWLWLAGGAYLLFSLLVTILALGTGTALFPVCLKIFKSLFNLAADLSSFIFRLIQQAYGLAKALRIFIEVVGGLLSNIFPSTSLGLAALILGGAGSLALLWSMLRQVKLSDRR
ncbi:MAG: zf-HC2 domain-containing protein [Candidatus Saccharicenans sp.]|nr:zf-HC2 domain-containing protein [Candidatus Saccharicenans sp.]MDI6849118.1 zf-HC2 domain-containing protein [Candidatus Saccharicenans sp.]